jgi:hypothetical protein
MNDDCYPTREQLVDENKRLRTLVDDLTVVLGEIIPTSYPIDGTAHYFNQWHAKKERAKAALAKARETILD